MPQLFLDNDGVLAAIAALISLGILEATDER
jgi:hypothetical protein